MIRGNRVLAVIPARGGSKGIPKKNIVTLLGKPLLYYAGDIAKQTKEIDRVIVSTDCEEIAAVARRYEIDAPFRRPASISDDTASDIDVLHHALRTMEEVDNTIYDIVVLLQPTAPLRKVEDVVGTLTKLAQSNFDAIWTISKTEIKYHPAKQLTLVDDFISYVLPEGRQIPRRQDLEPTYHVNGVAYALTRECILDQKTRLGHRTGGFIIPGPSVSIDEFADLEVVERILKERKCFS